MDENAAGLVGGVFYLAVVIVYVIALWKIYVKAGKPGWAAVVPFYNIYVLLKIVGRPWWWILLLLVPIVNIVITVIVAMDLAKVFRRSTAFGVVCLFLFSFVGYLILGFGKSTYTAPTTGTPPTPAAPAAPTPPPTLPAQS